VLAQEIQAASHAKVRFTYGVFDVQFDEVAVLINIVEGGNDCAGAQSARQGGITPDGGVFFAVPELVAETKGNDGSVRQRQARFILALPTIHGAFFVEKIDPLPVWRKETAAAIVPGAEFPISGAHVAIVRMRQAERDVVIVVIKDTAAINGEESFLLK